MTFWILAGAVCVVLFALAWWSSGRAAGRLHVGRRAALRDAEAGARTEMDGIHPPSLGAGF